MTISPEFRLDVRRQLLLVFVDFVVIICILLVFNLVSPVREVFAPLAGELHVLPALLLFVTTLVLIAPVIVNVASRLRFIAFMIMVNISEGGRHSLTGRMRIYRIFRNVGQVLTALILFLVLIPFLPPVYALDSTAILGLSMLVVGLSALSWGLLRPAFNRASTAIASRMVILDSDDEVVMERLCEE
jgi:hypothetical protein